MTSKPQFDGELVRLDKLIKSSSVRNRDANCTDVYSVTNSKGFMPSEEYFSKEVYSKELTTYKLVSRNMIAYNPSRINVGSVDVQDKANAAIVSPLYVVLSTDATRLIPAYLVRFLKSKSGLNQIAFQSIGTVRNNLKFDALCRMEMVLPSLETQNERLGLLGLIEDKIDLCDQQITALSDLVKSRFVEMFGDPISNNKGLRTIEGRKLLKLGNGKSKPMDNRLEEGVPAYGGNGISWYTDEAMITDQTIVIGRVGRHCGNARLVTSPCWVTDNAMYVKRLYIAEINLVYLINLMNIVGFNRYADKGDLWKITQQPFVDFDYPVPPLALQQEFATFVQHVDKLRFKSE